MKIACLVILSLIPVALSQDSASSSGEDTPRVKRAGFSLLNGALQNIQKSAFSASASLSSGSSGSSSGGGHSSQDEHVHTHTYSEGGGYEEAHHDSSSKGFDGGELKKSIINTLLQAVKAIAGGVVSLKGQLIKGSGYLVSSGGKLIATGGDAVSDAGNNIIHSAHLVKPESGGHGGYSSGGGHGSIGHSLGGAFSGFSSGIAKSISGLSAGSAGSITKLSSSSSSSSSHQVAHLSGSSSSSSSNQIGHLSSGSSKQVGQLSSGSSSQSAHLSSGSSSSSSGGSSGHHGNSGGDSQGHGQSYTSHGEGPSYTYNIPESSYDGGYDAKPAVVLDSYGPPKGHHHQAEPTIAYVQEPQSSYGAPSYNDGFSSSQEASDVLSQILKDLPHKPMKTVGQYSGGHSFNQISSSDDHLPPFKPLNDYPSYHPDNILPEYGPPTHFSDFTGQASVAKPLTVNPKAYDTYHLMKVKMTKEKNFVTPLPSVFDNYKGLEIQKSIAYEFQA